MIRIDVICIIAFMFCLVGVTFTKDIKVLKLIGYVDIIYCVADQLEDIVRRI